MTGKFVQEWQTFLAASGKDIKELDAAPGVSYLLAVKDSEEIVSSTSIIQVFAPRSYLA